ncbi:alpha/beta hydrolase family protein [Methylobacterium aquaticum]|uniref:alpha/beta hydrolase family protein n=1 Tax=Methylobacterium aquaticum TaxID=270351 RepID=UPI003D173717
MLLLHGAEGPNRRWTETMAMFLASQGFVAAPFPYSRGGNEQHSGDIVEVELAETVEAFSLMRADPRVSGPMGLWGISRGAEHALLLVSLMARDGTPNLPRAVAVLAATDVIWAAFRAAYTDPRHPEPIDWTKRAWLWHGSSDGLEPRTPIAIEHYDGPLHISHGEADKTWSVEGTRRIEARLLAHGRTPEMRYYPGQGHGLGPEAASLDRMRVADFFRRTLVG